MTLLDEARVAETRHGPDCRVSAVKRTLDGSLPGELDALLAAVADKSVYSTTAASVLKAHDIIVSPDSLRRHARGQCACSDAAA